MDRCKTCKHWQPIDGNVSGVEWNQASTWPKGGLCGMLRSGFVGWLGGSLAGLMVTTHDGRHNADAKLVTHEQFGCIQHEPKPPEKPQ